MATKDTSAQNIRVRVLLHPEKGEGRRPWRCPEEVNIEFTRTTGKAEPTSFVTQADGIVEARLVPGTYQVRIAGDARFALWAPGELVVPRPSEEAERAEELHVAIAPQDGYRLVVVRLVTAQGDPVTGGTVAISAAQGNVTTEFQGFPNGNIYAAAPKGNVTLGFTSVQVDDVWYCPQATVVPYTVSTVTEVRALEFIYWPQITIKASPTIQQANGLSVPLIGTEVTVEYQASDQDVGTSRTKTLESGDAVCFEYPFPGWYTVAFTSPATWDDLPITAVQRRTSQKLSSGQCWPVGAEFTLVPTQDITIQVTTPGGQPLISDLQFEISYDGGSFQSIDVLVEQATNKGIKTVPAGGTATINLVSAAACAANPVSGRATLYEIPLKMSQPGQKLVPGVNTVALEPEYPLTIDARDELNQPVVGVMIDVFDSQNIHVGEGITDGNGSVVIGVGGRGTYYASERSVGGRPMVLNSATVNSPGDLTLRIKGGPDGEALTDLSAYPVLTEEISTTGVPGPAATGPSGGGAGAGYGQTVDQVMRDVLGWRPGGDVAGFQAALTGAFQLRAVEGHTEWTWQQRGYAVQADMGALTGAQASIYARATAALDQIRPLLAGLTSLNPAKYEPQDLETIRSVVGTELQELVSELALEGGPRIQRVDELFRLLLGTGTKSGSMDPDQVQGNLGTLRQRFALTVDEIQTVDEERIVTNFRIIVEQVLALYTSWTFDRKLLAGVGPKASLGTILIRLSRGLEAVCESVGDLMFALDSVYVDAAQQQVIELRFADLDVKDVPEIPFRGNPPQATCKSLGHQAPMFLSDLLDWVLRASRDEGPRIIQDAGRDGVLAFKPVLNTLRVLVRAAGQIARERTSRNVMPAGMRTPRVDRAIKMLADQLDEAANLASLVRFEQAPQIAFAAIHAPGGSGIIDPNAGKPPVQIEITMTGNNFRGPAEAILMAEDSEDLPTLRVKAMVSNPNIACATFDNPCADAVNAGTTWLLSIINNDGAQSTPIEALRVNRWTRKSTS